MPSPALRFRPIRRLNGFAAVARHKRSLILAALLIGAVLAALRAANADQGLLGGLFSFLPNGVFFPNPNGASQTYSTNAGGIDETGPFFQSLGTNGRAWAPTGSRWS